MPTGFHINFLRAERSLHRWARDDVARIHAAEAAASADAGGVEMHVLEDAGHWVSEGGTQRIGHGWRDMRGNGPSSFSC